MDKDSLRRLQEQLLEPRVPCGNQYSPHRPHPKQAAFLGLNTREALFGGAAGGGKTDALLMAALQYACVPGYSALMLRETYPQLIQDEGIIPRSMEWLGGTNAVWSASQTRWTFPSGATLSFGHIERDEVRYKFAGGAWQFIAWDELVNWKNDTAYRFLFSRLRRPMPSEELKACPECGLTVADVPLRMRAGTNPGSRGAAWVYDRFIGPWRDYKMEGGEKPERIFVPSRISDNPSLDAESYTEALQELDPITRAQLLEGDWDVRADGGMFAADWFPFEKSFPKEGKLMRFWDLAATAAKDAYDPDWTVGALVCLHEGRWWIVDIKRVRESPLGVERLIELTAKTDAVEYGNVPIRMEQEPGSGGKIVIDQYARRVLAGEDFKGIRSTGKKVDRARPFASAAEARNVIICRGEFNKALLQELVLFPIGSHDDQIDAISGAMAELSGSKRRTRLLV